MIERIIIIVLYFLLASSLLVEYAPHCKDLNAGDRFIVMMIFLIGAPAFALVNLLTAILDGILPDNWDS